MIRPPGTSLHTLALAVVVVSLSEPSPLAAQRAAQPAQAACTVREISRDVLRLAPNVEAYVEPRNVVASGDELLIAGKPSFTWKTGGATADMVSRNHLFGLIVRPGGVVREVEAPRWAGRVKPVAAAQIRDGTWGFILLEITPGSDTTTWYRATSGGAKIDRVWYAEYGRTGWSRFEALPFPDGATLFDLMGSQLAVSGDTTIWSAPVALPGALNVATVFERVAGRWRIEQVNPAVVAAYTTLTHSTRDGFVLGIAHADTSLQYDLNSLFLYQRSSSWTAGRKVVAGTAHPAYFPVLTPDARTVLTLTWVTLDGENRGMARTMSGDLLRETIAPTPLKHLDPADITTIATEDGPLWVAAESGTEPTLTILRSTPAGAVGALWRTPNPFTGYFGAALIRRTQLVIAGPSLDRPARKVVTLLIRLELNCTERR